MDVVVWLRSLGLGKYEAAFRENEIDETVLPSLTEEHLKQLGVTALGHRLNPIGRRAPSKSSAQESTVPGGKTRDVAVLPVAGGTRFESIITARGLILAGAASVFESARAIDGIAVTTPF
jgi:hypothetical protein